MSRPNAKDGMLVLYANQSWSNRALTEVHVREFWVGPEFCVIWSRIFPEVWVTDCVLLSPKSPMWSGFLGLGVEQGAQVRAVKASAELGSGRHCASPCESTAKLNK